MDSEQRPRMLFCSSSAPLWQVAKGAAPSTKLPVPVASSYFSVVKAAAVATSSASSLSSEARALAASAALASGAGQPYFKDTAPLAELKGVIGDAGRGLSSYAAES